MGFFDNLKEAMQRGNEAANNYIERENANKAAAAQAQKAQTQPAPKKSNLPEGVFMVLLNRIEPVILGPNGEGKTVVVGIDGAILAKDVVNPGSDDGENRKKILKIVGEYVTNDIKANAGSMSDVKFVLKYRTNLGERVIGLLKENGFEAAYKLPLMIHPKVKE